MMIKKYQAGQAVLVVLLSLSVVLIIVLYIMSRSITDLSLSSKEENSLRAFSAAEAGIERALVAGSNSNPNFNGAIFNATVSPIGGQTAVYPFSLKSGEVASFWFMDENNATFFKGNHMDVCWGTSGTSLDDQTPALELTIYHGTISTPSISRFTLDPVSNRSPANNFDNNTSGPCTIDTENFQFKTRVNFPPLGITEDLLYMNARILYNTTISHRVGIDIKDNGVGHQLPIQGSKITSTGSFQDSNRKIDVYQVRKAVPPIFESAIFSSSGVVK